MRKDKRKKRTILTQNGLLAYTRTILRPSDKKNLEKLQSLEGKKSVAPLDFYLGIDTLPFKMTAGAMLQVAYLAQNQCSYQRAEDAIMQFHHVRINDDTIRSVTNFIGGIVFAEDCRRADEHYNLLKTAKLPFDQDKKGVLYLECDGAALNTRHKNSDGSTWRENKLCMAFSSDNIHSWIDKKGKRQHQIGKREYVSYIGSVTEFKKHMLTCAVRNGYGKYKKTIVISDGAIWIENLIDEVFHGSLHILDFFHLSENVFEYSKYLFNMDETKYQPWAKEICHSLRLSDYKAVLGELEPLKDKLSKCPINLYNYITNNINNIDYKYYEKKGYFIGSGAIESGNKIILQQRLKQAGMRWNVKSAQALLTLRTKAESGIWKLDVEDLIYRIFR